MYVLPAVLIWGWRNKILRESCVVYDEWSCCLICGQIVRGIFAGHSAWALDLIRSSSFKTMTLGTVSFKSTSTVHNWRILPSQAEPTLISLPFYPFVRGNRRWFDPVHLKLFSKHIPRATLPGEFDQRYNHHDFGQIHLYERYLDAHLIRGSFSHTLYKPEPI